MNSSSSDQSTSRVALVMNGVVHLSSDEREECVRQLNAFQDGTAQDRRLITEGVEHRIARVTLGPISGGCTCCGRK